MDIIFELQVDWIADILHSVTFVLFEVFWWGRESFCLTNAMSGIYIFICTSFFICPVAIKKCYESLNRSYLGFYRVKFVIK